MSHFGITEYPNMFKRQGAFPLDGSSVFKSLNDAIEYAKSSPIAYEGQIISVIENNVTTIYTLNKSVVANTNYELSSVTSSSSNDLNDAIININNLINSKVGLWTISQKPNTLEAYLDFDILYPLEANSYEVFFNDESVSTILNLTDEFITTLKTFKDDSTLITIKFYNDNLPVFKLEAKAMYKNNVVILGNLYLIELYDASVS